MSDSTAAGMLADKLVQLSGATLDEDLIEIARRRIFDTLGSMRAGLPISEVERVAGALGWDERGPIGNVRRCSAAVRASEIDDIHAPSSTTAGSVAVPVALAVGLATGADDRDVLAGIVAGYEAMARFGAAIDGANVTYRGIWGSYVTAPIGAAGATARVLGLDATQTAHALRIASSRLTGGQARAQDPSPRHLSFGCAATDGVLAAVAAANGVTGKPDALEEAVPVGIHVEFDEAIFRDQLDVGWIINEVDVKPFRTARQALSAIEAVRTAAGQLGDKAIEQITIGIPSQVRAMIDKPNTNAVGLQTSGSVQFQSTLALVRSDDLYNVSRTDVKADDEIVRLMAAMHVEVDDALSALYPAHWGGRAEVHAVSGEVCAVEVHDPMGSAQHPFDWDGLFEKQARTFGADDRLQRFMAACQGFARTRGTKGDTRAIFALAEAGLSVPAFVE